MSKPSLPFYPDNWLNDAALRLCSPATRGIWMDLICLAHQGEPYGHLRVAGEQLTVKYMANRCTVSTRELNVALAELEANGVFSRTEDGTIYSRRMVRDEHNRIARGKGGAKSLINPSVPRPKDIHKGILPPHSPDPSFDLEKERINGFSVVKKNSFTEKLKYDYMPGWKWFAAEYPAHRFNPNTAYGFWVTTVESMETEELIREKLPKFKRSQQWLNKAGQYIPDAAKFLADRYFDMQPGPEPTDENGNSSAEARRKRANLDAIREAKEEEFGEDFGSDRTDHETRTHARIPAGSSRCQGRSQGSQRCGTGLKTGRAGSRKAA